MVQGIEKFKEYFKGYTGQYVFIGGTACDIILEREGIPFRKTKDLDIVLIMEMLNDEFVNTFVEFVLAAGYAHIKKGSGENQFYRFEKPLDKNFPYMIELFSRKPDYLKTLDIRLAPIHVSNDVMSLSAILLNEEYYSLLAQGALEIEGVSVLKLESLVLFKMKAWLDLTERKQSGEQIDSYTIKKHKNDVIRLVMNMHPEMKLKTTGKVKEDVTRFIRNTRSEHIELKNLGIKEYTYDQILNKLEKCYN
ncbi:hypothetical protein [uncultured Robinsoniella sp.]|uniref:hypothetical protein n=1 Tax=uncultured Robinsoniella sp. TaxID=904190 RepID=UPI00374E5DC5